jgi:hypothetical protein
MAENILYYGDNLEILRRYIEDESVDLVYLDPPFNSDQDYNILFAERNDSHPVGRVCSAHHFPYRLAPTPVVGGYWVGSSYRKPKGKQKPHPEFDYSDQ